jgi:hypothetical protein
MNSERDAKVREDRSLRKRLAKEKRKIAQKITV